MNDTYFAALAAAKGLPASPKELDRLGKLFGEEASRWAFSQWELRERAKARFEQASEMLFTREGLEQASHPAIARYRASRFPEGQWVADLTCSIGSDLIALAERGPTLGTDIDSERLNCASHNLSVCGVSAQISQADCLSFPWDFEFAIADPSRRVDGRRKANIDDFEPNPDKLAERMLDLQLGCLKLTPMLSDSELEGFGGQLEFLSFGGECREASVWLGRHVEASRKAIHIESGEALEASESSDSDAASEFLFEADPAAIRGHCLGTLCNQFGIWKLGDSNGYLTGPKAIESVWLAGYRVLSDCKADDKALRLKLRELAATIDAVKSRVKGIEPELVRKKLQIEGNRGVILVAFPVGKSHRWLIVERL